MRQRPFVFAGAATLAALLFWAVLQTSESLPIVKRLLGASQPRRTRTVEVPPLDESHPVANAARRLIQPLGGVRLIRTLETPDTPAPTSDAAQR